MAPWVILAVGAAYLYVAVELFLKGNYPLALTFGAYSLSNVGLYLAAK